MRAMQVFWAMQPTNVRFFILALLAVFLGSTVQFARLAWRLRQCGSEPASPGEKGFQASRVEESTVVFMLETCYADLQSTKAASMVAFLLSLAMAAYGASPIYRELCNNGSLTGSSCLLSTADQLSALLALGFSICIVLYLTSSFFEWDLRNRKARCRYFYARKQGGSEGQP